VDLDLTLLFQHRHGDLHHWPDPTGPGQCPSTAAVEG